MLRKAGFWDGMRSEWYRKGLGEHAGPAGAAQRPYGGHVYWKKDRQGGQVGGGAATGPVQPQYRRYEDGQAGPAQPSYGGDDAYPYAYGYGDCYGHGQGAHPPYAAYGHGYGDEYGYGDGERQGGSGGAGAGSVMPREEDAAMAVDGVDAAHGMDMDGGAEAQACPPAGSWAVAGANPGASTSANANSYAGNAIASASHNRHRLILPRPRTLS
jgi:hypothetical protein